jgi:recombination protein RecA
VAAEHLVIARPDSGEAALQVVDELLRAKAAEVIVVDSVAALVPRAELALPMGTAPAGHLARLMSQSIRRLTLQAAKSRAVVIFVNQFRRSWGEDGRGYDVTTGGNALVYAAATRLFLTRREEQVQVTLQKARFGDEGRTVALSSPAAPTG